MLMKSRRKKGKLFFFQKIEGPLTGMLPGVLHKKKQYKPVGWSVLPKKKIIIFYSSSSKRIV